MNTRPRLFAPPRFLLMPAAGIEISDAFVRALLLEGTPGNLRVAWWAEEPLPSGAVVGGVIHHEEAVVSVLAKIRAEHPFDCAHFSLPEQRAFLCEMDAAAESAAEARTAVGLHLEEEVPISAADALFDLAPLAKGRWRVATVPRATVEALEALCTKVGIAPLSFDAEPCAVARAAVGARNRHALLVIHLSEDDTGLYVAVSGAVRFALTVPSVIEQPEQVALLADEVRRVRGFWEAQNKGGIARHIEAAVACGRGAGTPAVLAAFSSALALPVERALVWQNVLSVDEAVPPLPHGDSLRFATSIGLALRAFSYV